LILYTDQKHIFSQVKKAGQKLKMLLWGLIVLGALSYGQPFASLYHDPKEVLRNKWPSCALWRMLALVDETPTHHRHYLRPQDLDSLYMHRRINQWISSQLSKGKSYPPKSLSCFLVRPEEIPLFLIYVDTLIRMNYFDVINFDLKKHYFVIALHFPFKNRALGLSFSKDPLTHLLKVKKAPYLKIVFRSNKVLATIYPVALE